MKNIFELRPSGVVFKIIPALLPENELPVNKLNII
jgi:hypothetical protein